MDHFENSQWIWAQCTRSVNVYANFSDRFSLTKEEMQKGDFHFYISVDSDYALYLNGALVTFGQFADYAFDKVYDALLLDDFLQEGENLLRVECWHSGKNSSTGVADQAGLIYALYHGEKPLCVSSQATPCAIYTAYDMGESVELVTGQLGFSFHYDSCREKEAPAETICVEKPFPNRARPIKKLSVGEKASATLTVSGSFSANGGDTVGKEMGQVGIFSKPYEPKALPFAEGVLLEKSPEEPGDGLFLLIDLHKESAGILSLDFEAEADCKVLIGWGEHLEDLRLRTFVGGRNFAASYHAHKGENHFVHPFRRLGLRYLQLHIYSSKIKLYYAGILPVIYPLSHIKKFTCADSLHNRIYEVCRDTLRLSMHEHYEDCPWREQALYTMDSRNQMLCGYHAFSEYAFPKASLRLLAESLRKDRLLELCAPAKVNANIPCYSAIYLVQVEEYLRYTGDLPFVQEVFSCMKTLAEQFLEKVNPQNGLIPRFPKPYWNFYEWQIGLSGGQDDTIWDGKEVYDAPLCAFVAMGWKAFSTICRTLGKEEEANRYSQAAQALIKNTERVFWSEEKKAFASYYTPEGEQTTHFAALTNALILYTDPQYARKAEVLQALSNNSLIPITLSHSIFRYEVLLMDAPRYGRYVFREIAEIWGKMLFQGATSFWETEDGAYAFDNAGSLCHGWSAIPLYLYLKYAAHLDSTITGLYECRVEE